MQETEWNKADPYNFIVSQEQVHTEWPRSWEKKEKKQKITNGWGYCFGLTSIAESWAALLPRLLWWKCHKVFFSKDLLSFFQFQWTNYRSEVLYWSLTQSNFFSVVFKEARAFNFLAFYIAWLQSTSQSEEMPEMPTELCTQSKRDGHLQELSFCTERGM